MTRRARLVPILLSAGAFAVAAVALLAVLFMSSRFDEPAEVFVRDVTAVVGVPWYYGMVSLLGVVVWGATAAWATSRALAGGRSARPMAVLALLAALLCADDALLIHEQGNFPVSGTPELVYVGLYAAFAVLLLALLVRAGLHGAVALLVGAGAALVASVGVDVVLSDGYVTEDVLKLTGALLLLCVPVQDQLRAQADDRAAASVDRAQPPHVVDLRDPVSTRVDR